MTSAQQGFDPFEQGDGVKATTFKNAPYGSMLTIQIDDDAKWLQTRDFKTGEPAYWDARPGETPNPKMAAVITGTVADTPWAQQSGQAGERRSIWAEKPSNLFTAIQNAKRAAANGGSPLPILAGGTLDIAFTGEEPAKDPRNNPIKLYQARYTPPPAGFGRQDAFEGGQVFTGQQPQQAPAQFAQGGPVQQPQQQFAQQAPVQQPFQQAPAPQQPAAAPFGQQPQQQFAQGGPVQQPQQQFAQQAAPAGDPWSQQASAQQQPQQQPAMAGAPAGDPWASAPSQDVPNF